MRSSKSSMKSSLRRFTKLGVLKHVSSLPLWTSTIIWMPPNKEGHLPSTWVSLMRSELIIKTLINMRLLSTQLLRPEVGEMEKDTSLQKEWTDHWVIRNCRDFLKQRRYNLIHVSSKINDPRVSERLGPLPYPRPATNLGKGQQVLEKHKGIGDSEMFRQTCSWSNLPTSKKRWRFTKESSNGTWLHSGPSYPTAS